MVYKVEADATVIKGFGLGGKWSGEPALCIADIWKRWVETVAAGFEGSE